MGAGMEDTQHERCPAFFLPLARSAWHGLRLVHYRTPSMHAHAYTLLTIIMHP